MKNLKLARNLLVLCCIVVISFQSYWINSLYRNEKKLIAQTTNALFKETIYEVQDRQAMKDTAFISKAINNLQNLKTVGEEATNYAGKIWDDIKNSFKLIDKKNIETYQEKKFVDGLEKSLSKVVAKDSNKAHDQDAELSAYLPLTDINGLYKNKLSNSENDIDLPFSILVDSSYNLNKEVRESNNFQIKTDKVAIGKKNKVAYQAMFNEYQYHILIKILPQIIISLLIGIFSILVFVFAYKTLSKQRELVAAKNDLISNITHEFKTPITTISVAIEAITKFGVIDDKEMTKEYLQVSTEELNRLNLLVDKVLKLSLFESGKTELKTEKVNINKIVDEVIQSMKPQLNKYNATIKLNAYDDLNVQADKGHIKSVVYNLIDNALKYCDKEPNIYVELKSINGFAEIVVEDNGIGIAQQHQARVFDKFYRVPQGNTHNAKGYGLGLSYIKHIVDMHNGSIELESAVGKGTKFVVKLRGQ